MKREGFTLVELLVVMALIAVLASFIVGGIRIAQGSARNTQKVSDMRTITMALDAYHTKYGRFPTPVGNATCGGWEIGNLDSTSFLTALENLGIGKIPTDPSSPTGVCYGYKYFRYSRGQYGCNDAAYYVIGFTNFDKASVNAKDKASPGWQCPSRNWQNEFAWVTGAYE